MMLAVIGFWSHALAAIAFASILLWRVTRPVTRPGQALMLAALALTACWAWLSGIEPASALARHSETARNLLWIGLLYAMSSASEGRLRGVGMVYAAVALVLGLQFVATGLVSPGTSLESSQILRIIAAAGSLVLVHNLYAQSAPATRSALRFTMAGLAAMWLYDLNYYTVGNLGGDGALGAWRGVAMLMIAPLFALGAREDQGAARISLSRSASFQSLSILAICAYFALMVVLSTALRDSAHDWLTIATVAMLALMTVAAMVVIPSSRARGWVKAMLARHLFEHRYDYRSEWLRFSETLGHSDSRLGTAPRAHHQGVRRHLRGRARPPPDRRRGRAVGFGEPRLGQSLFPAADRLGDAAPLLERHGSLGAHPRAGRASRRLRQGGRQGRWSARLAARRPQPVDRHPPHPRRAHGRPGRPRAHRRTAARSTGRISTS